MTDVGKLEPWSHKDDFRQVEMLEQGNPETLIERIILLPSARGMTGIYGWHISPDKVRFGAKCPAAELDLGIAPLVKAIPGLGILTHLSCDGHGKKPPWISFRNIEQKENLVRIIAVTKGDAAQLIKSVDPDSDSRISFVPNTSWTPELMPQVCDSLFQLAREIRKNFVSLRYVVKPNKAA